MKLSKELIDFMYPIWGVRMNEKGEVVEKPLPENYTYKGDVMRVDSARYDPAVKAYNKAVKVIKLPTLSEFAKESFELIKYYGSRQPWEHAIRINHYGRFISQPNEIHLYVACKDGKVLEEPKPYTDGRSNADIEARKFEYRAACDTVIFPGWVCVADGTGGIVILNVETKTKIRFKHGLPESNVTGVWSIIDSIEPVIQHGLYYKLK